MEKMKIVEKANCWKPSFSLGKTTIFKVCQVFKKRVQQCKNAIKKALFFIDFYFKIDAELHNICFGTRNCQKKSSIDHLVCQKFDFRWILGARPDPKMTQKSKMWGGSPGVAPRWDHPCAQKGTCGGSGPAWTLHDVPNWLRFSHREV